jgi:hypothetical protein
MFKQPPQGSPINDLFCQSDLEDIAAGKRPIYVSRRDIVRAAKRLFEDNPKLERAVFFRMNPINQLELVSVGRTGRIRREWLFGAVPKNVRII